MVKKFDKSHKIYVELSLTLVKHGFSYIGEVELDDLDGKCRECGHQIKYEHWIKDEETDKEYSYGSVCIHKLYVLKYWGEKIKIEDLEDSQLLRAGKWQWVMDRDNYKKWLKDKKIPNPDDYKNYKDLADSLKRLVFLARRRIKKEEERKAKEEERKRKKEKIKNEWEEFIGKHSIDLSLVSQKEKEFLTTVQKYERRGWELSKKQEKWFESIKNREEKKEYNKIDEEEIEEIEKKAEKCIKNWDKLTNWEQDFVESISEQVQKGRVLSQKQKNTLTKIMNNRFGSESDFNGKKINPWIINEKFGVWESGAVVSVVRETNKAILAKIRIGNMQNTRDEVWIPKSQIIDEVIL